MWRPGSDEKLDVNLVDESELIDIQMTEISSDHSYSSPRCSDVCTRWLLNTSLSIYRHPVSGISGRRHLRSTDHGHLDFPRVKLASYRHTEDVHLHTPALRDLRDSSLSLSCFKRHLKTYIHSTRLAHPERLGFFYKNALYKFAFIIITLLAVAADLMH